MTDLYTEALKDAQKIREIAETDAKNRLVEALTPYIKKVIAKEAAGDSDFYFEQNDNPEDDEDALDLNNPTDVPAAVAPQAPVPEGQPSSQAGTAPQAPQTTPGLTVNSTPTDVMGDEATTLPIKTPGSEELVNGSMPDSDGKITVDFEDLFVNGTSDQVTITPQGQMAPMEAPVAPTGGEEVSPGLGVDKTLNTGNEPPVANGEPLEPLEPTEDEEQLDLSTKESINYKDYKRVFSNISERIDMTLYKDKVSNIVFETLKQRLFDLLEAVDTMRDRGTISGKQAQLNENKLEFLFIKLKEASLHNSYSSNRNKSPDMTTLKEFAAQLFEEDENLAKDSVSSGKTGVPVDEEYSAHAAKVSGVDPKLGGAKDIKVSQSKHLGKGEALPDSSDPDEKPWGEGSPTVNENSAVGLDDTDEKPSDEFEVDDAELAEAVRSIRKESIKKKLSALREAEKKEGLNVETSEDYPDPGPEGGEDPSHDKLKEMLEMRMNEMMDEQDDDDNDEDEDMSKVLDDDEMSVEDDLDSDEELPEDEDADLVLSIDLPPEVEKELATLGLDDLDVDVALNVSTDLDDDEEDEEEEIEISDDEDEDEDEMPEEEVLEDEYMGGVDEMKEMKKMKNEAKRQANKAKLLEKKLQKAVRLLRLQNNKLTNLEEQLVETNLFTSKAVYYSKFLQRALTEKALSKKALQQIVEHLDKGRSVAETKAIYKKIENKLNEHANASRKLGGSSSKVTRPGSANLNESANSQTRNDPETQSSNRWQLLAGIKK